MPGRPGGFLGSLLLNQADADAGFATQQPVEFLRRAEPDSDMIRQNARERRICRGADQFVVVDAKDGYLSGDVELETTAGVEHGERGTVARGEYGERPGQSCERAEKGFVLPVVGVVVADDKGLDIEV